jgi:hypothetical protein
VRAGMVGHSRPPRNFWNFQGFRREDQLADGNPANHGRGCVKGHAHPRLQAHQDVFSEPS